MPYRLLSAALLISGWALQTASAQTTPVPAPQDASDVLAITPPTQTPADELQRAYASMPPPGAAPQQPAKFTPAPTPAARLVVAHHSAGHVHAPHIRHPN